MELGERVTEQAGQDHTASSQFGHSQSPPGRALERHPLPVTLDSRDQQPVVVLRSPEYKGSTAGRAGVGEWAAQSQACCDNRSFQSRGRVPAETGDKRHSWLWYRAEEPDNSWGRHPEVRWDGRGQLPGPVKAEFPVGEPTLGTFQT